jgi:hypothetical protein
VVILQKNKEKCNSNFGKYFNNKINGLIVALPIKNILTIQFPYEKFVIFYIPLKLKYLSNILISLFYIKICLIVSNKLYWKMEWPKLSFYTPSALNWIRIRYSNLDLSCCPDLKSNTGLTNLNSWTSKKEMKIINFCCYYPNSKPALFIYCFWKSKVRR